MGKMCHYYSSKTPLRPSMGNHQVKRICCVPSLHMHAKEDKVKLVLMLKQFFPCRRQTIVIDMTPCISKEMCMDWTNYICLGRISFTWCYKIHVLISLLRRRMWRVPMTSSAIGSLPSTDDELSESFTQIANDKTCTHSAVVIVSLVEPHAWQPFAQSSDPLPTPLQVFFSMKTLGTQLYTIVRTGKG